MNRRMVYGIFAGITLIVIIVVAFFVIQPSRILTFSGHFKDFVGGEEEGIGLEVDVSGWIPLGPMTIVQKVVYGILGSFWLVDGNKYTSVSATLKVKITYQGIKVGSLNVTINALWLQDSTGTKKSYIINSPQNGINSATDGVWDRYSSNPFTGSKTVDQVATELSLPTDGSTVTVDNRFQVQAKGIGAKSGQTLTVDTGVKSPSPASNNWQYYTESTSSPTASGTVSFASWTDFAFGAIWGVLLVVIIVFGVRRYEE